MGCLRKGPRVGKEPLPRIGSAGLDPLEQEDFRRSNRRTDDS